MVTDVNYLACFPFFYRIIKKARMKALSQLLTFGFCFFALSGFAQVTISDVELPAKMKSSGVSFDLNGGGLREKLWIDLYVGGLYLVEKTSDAKQVMNADKPMMIHLEIVSTLITSEKMIKACNEGFEKSTKGNTAPLQKEIDAFIDAFKEEIREKDTYTLTYVPGKGTDIYKNNKLIKTIAGLPFKRALFGIWMCDEPADEDLKEGMLGL